MGEVDRVGNKWSRTTSGAVVEGMRVKAEGALKKEALTLCPLPEGEGKLVEIFI